MFVVLRGGAWRGDVQHWLLCQEVFLVFFVVGGFCICLVFTTKNYSSNPHFSCLLSFSYLTCSSKLAVFDFHTVPPSWDSLFLCWGENKNAYFWLSYALKLKYFLFHEIILLWLTDIIRNNSVITSNVAIASWFW